MMTAERYKNYYKNHFRIKFSRNDVANYRKWFYPQWRLIRSLVKINSPDKILEIGSGIGGFYSFVVECIKKSNYRGLELDISAVKFANKVFDTKSFIYSSFENFSSKKRYDFIFAFEVLEHMENPNLTIGKIIQLLKVNGYFIGTSPFPFPGNILADKTHLYVLHPENWKKLLLENGFREVKTYPMSFLPFIWKISKHLNFRIPFYLPFKNMISTCLIIAKK